MTIAHVGLNVKGQNVVDLTLSVAILVLYSRGKLHCALTAVPMQSPSEFEHLWLTKELSIAFAVI